MYGDDGLGARGDRGLNVFDADVITPLVGIDRHRSRAYLRDGQPRRNEGVRGYDNLVACADVERTQDQTKSLQPVAHADTMSSRTVRGKPGLEIFNFRP